MSRGRVRLSTRWAILRVKVTPGLQSSCIYTGERMSLGAVPGSTVCRLPWPLRVETVLGQDGVPSSQQTRKSPEARAVPLCPPGGSPSIGMELFHLRWGSLRAVPPPSAWGFTPPICCCRHTAALPRAGAGGPRIPGAVVHWRECSSILLDFKYGQRQESGERRWRGEDGTVTPVRGYTPPPA